MTDAITTLIPDATISMSTVAPNGATEPSKRKTGKRTSTTSIASVPAALAAAGIGGPVKPWPAVEKRIGRDGNARKAIAKRIGRDGKKPADNAAASQNLYQSPHLDLEDAETAWVAKISAALAKIKTAWRKTVEAHFEVGDLLAAAKVDIGHGNWMRMCEMKLPFSIWTARRLMHIAADQRLRNGALVPHLPPNWSILFELSQWDDKELAQALAEGLIHPEMTKEDAANLLTPPPPPPRLAPSILDALRYTYPSQADFLEFIEQYCSNIPKIEIFRPTGPRKRWQRWGVEITECPETRTVVIKPLSDYFVFRIPEKATANWSEIEQRRCVNCGRRHPAHAAHECGAGERERAVEAIKIIKSVVGFNKYKKSDLMTNRAFMFATEAARLVAPKKIGGNDRRNAVRLLKLAIEEIKAQ